MVVAVDDRDRGGARRRSAIKNVGFLFVCFFLFQLGNFWTPNLPGQRTDRWSEAAAGCDWLLLGSGRGYSWWELSLDHAS